MGELAAAAADFLPGVFSAASDAAPAFETGVATIGPAATDAIATTGGTLADIAGSGTDLFAGTTGLSGTSIAGGGGGDIASLLSGGGSAFSTASDFLAAPAASGFNASAVTASPTDFAGTGVTPSNGPPGGGPGTLGPLSPPPSAPTVGPGVTGSSVFDTGAPGLTGVSGTGSPAAITPAGASASSVSAPTGISGLTDPTAAGTAGEAAAQTAGGAAKSTSISDLLSKAGGGAIDSLTKSPIATALAAGGLGYNIYSGQQATKNQQALQADAKTATANSNQMVASGEALQAYLTNGTLPPAYQQQVDQAIADAKTKAISNAAAQGLPTDPAQNTALATTLASIDNQRGQMQTQVASQLFSSGTGLVNAGATAAGLSGDLYKTLVQNDTTQAANTGKAIATLAAALNGKSQANMGGTTITVGGNP